jgi:hypothetical protein
MSLSVGIDDSGASSARRMIAKERDEIDCATLCADVHLYDGFDIIDV